MYMEPMAPEMVNRFARTASVVKHPLVRVMERVRVQCRPHLWVLAKFGQNLFENQFSIVAVVGNSILCNGMQFRLVKYVELLLR